MLQKKISLVHLKQKRREGIDLILEVMALNSTLNEFNLKL